MTHAFIRRGNDSTNTLIVGGSNLVGELTGVVSQVEKGLSADGLEQKLQTILGSTLAKVCRSNTTPRTILCQAF